ncbi:MAG: nucleotide exchange factor GrpE [Candidatus Nealsonbacteria bacterium]|nr:nucleotide exchange factor GrpE [Candidatus Nealsonbacteria bacterium]
MEDKFNEQVKEQGKEKEQTKLKDAEQQIKECRKQKDEYLAGWQRARADFLNYKRGEIERVEEILKYANLDLILKILFILDNFDLAEKELLKEMTKDKNADLVERKISIGVKGVLQIKTLFLDFLKNQEIEEIKAIGTKFDPNFHEAVEIVEPSFAEAFASKSGIVVEEIQKGYKLHGKVIRPTKVKVTK